MAVRLTPDRTVVEQDWHRGIVRDSAREQIPAGGAHDIVDFLADRPGMLYKRGGTAFQSSEIGGGKVLLVAAMAPEFPGDPRVLTIASDGGGTHDLYDVTGTTAGSALEIHDAQPIENPPLYVDRMILCDGIGNGAGTFHPPQKIYLSGGTLTVADLGGSPPNTRYSCVHLGYLVLANTVAHPNRLWFNPSGTPANTDIEDAWLLDDAYWDVPESITGLASINGVLLIFTRGFTWRLLRNLAPGLAGANMELQPLGAVGCIDARSIIKKDGLIYFANESGVYYTNGAGYQSITYREDNAGVSRMWVEAVAGFSPVLGSVVCAGVWLNNNLFFTVRHTDDDPQEGARYQFLYHGQTGAWTRLSDACTADMYTTRFAPDGEIYAACGDLDDPVRLLRLSPLFNPDDTNSVDANGEDVEPTVTFRPVYGRPGLKSFGFGHLTYQLELAGDPSAQLRVETERGLAASSNTLSRVMAASDEPGRERFDVNFDSSAATVKVVQEGPSATTEIHAVEVEVRAYDLDSEEA